MSGTPLALLSLGVALRSATRLSATLEPVVNWKLHKNGQTIQTNCKLHTNGQTHSVQDFYIDV